MLYLTSCSKLSIIVFTLVSLLVFLKLLQFNESFIGERGRTFSFFPLDTLEQGFRGFIGYRPKRGFLAPLHPRSLSALSIGQRSVSIAGRRKKVEEEGIGLSSTLIPCFILYPPSLLPSLFISLTSSAPKGKRVFFI